MSTKVVPKVYHRRLLCKEKLFHFSVQTSKWELMNSFNKVQKEVSLCRQLFSKVWQHPELQFFTRLGPSSTEQGAGSSACALLVGRRLEKFHEVERRNERLGWFLVEVERIIRQFEYSTRFDPFFWWFDSIRDSILRFQIDSIRFVIRF